MVFDGVVCYYIMCFFGVKGDDFIFFVLVFFEVNLIKFFCEVFGFYSREIFFGSEVDDVFVLFVGV